jgi:hypothetical protein
MSESKRKRDMLNIQQKLEIVEQLKKGGMLNNLYYGVD